MKREEYIKNKLDYSLYGGGNISSNIKTVLIKNSNINKIILNKSSFIEAIETIHALKEEAIIWNIKIDNDLKTGNVLFFCEDELVGESL